ncbi:MAG: DUF192 domain-containing protein [Slackia sp.]|nr:DUF192 domain-containing protein [Slackia sp.]
MSAMGDERTPVLTGMFERLRGLKGFAADDAGAYVVLVPCCDVHTFGMRFSLDIAFVDASGMVVEVYRRVPPSRRIRCAKARLTLERKASSGAWFEKGESVFVRKP